MGGSVSLPGNGEILAEQFIRKYGTAGSGRGYIWTRSLQMVSQTIFLGHGPDTFALFFPNYDPYKVFYSQPQTLIDKPHNMYLQIWLNLGGLAALAFLAMAGLHAIRSFKISLAGQTGRRPAHAGVGTLPGLGGLSFGSHILRQRCFGRAEFLDHIRIKHGDERYS